jgi:RND family efflux transporter MFP subunit
MEKKKKNRVKITIIFVCLMLLAAGGLAVVAIFYNLRFNQTPARLLAQPLPVEALPAKVTTIEQTIGGSGEILQHETVNVTSRITSTAENIFNDIGDLVRNGQTIMKADSRIFDDQLVAAQQGLASAKTAVEKATEELEAEQALQKKGLASTLEIEQAQIALDQSKLSEAQAEAALLNIQLDVDFCVFKSPVNGIVLARFVNPSERFQLNQVLFQLGDLDQVYFLAQIQEEMVGYVKAEQNAEIVFPSFPGQIFTGKVEHVDPRTDPKTRTFTAYITIKNSDLKLKPGISGFARIKVTKLALAVPSVAVMNPVGENASVFVVNSQSQAELVPVRVGLNAGGMTEILAGLQEGQQVIAVGSLYLKNHDKVRVNPQ